jgi:Zn-dependent peptidase ImmA (M78 family)
LLLPAAQIRDLLPPVMGGNAWKTLAHLKEQWGVSIQALLYRARWLGRITDVSYRNAMTTISARGWRRNEPGLVTAIEQPSLLSRAVELLDQGGIDEVKLLEHCRVPRDLFHTIIARTPSSGPATPLPQREVSEEADGRVLSLLERT